MNQVSSRTTTLQPDDVVADKYRIYRKLAEGGMGAVYHAVQEPLGRDVALKTLKDVGDNEAKREERYKRFFREASFSSKLNHPNTVTIFDYGKLPDDGGFYLVMEFLEGRSLRDFMRERRRLSVPMTLHICTQIASSLTEAHEMGVIHRDLKPPNVMLVQRGDDPYFVKVVDFGLVKELEPKQGDEELTAENALIGSPRYMAPERFLYHSADSPSVDVYALGIMLYEMLVGRPPFIRSPESTLQHIMMQHVQAEVPAMHKFAPDLQLPSGLETLVMRCLAKEPGDRPTMAGLARLLKACAQGAPTIEREVDSLPTIDDVRPLMPGEASGEFVTDDTGRGVRPHHTGDATRPDMPAPQVQHAAPTQTATATDARAQAAPATETPARSPIGIVVAIAVVILFGAVAAAIAITSMGPDPTRFHVTSEPPGAYVYMGPRQLGQTPFDVELTIEESTTLRFTKAGHSDARFVLNPGMGESFDVAVDLGPTSAVSPVASPEQPSERQKPADAQATKGSDQAAAIANETVGTEQTEGDTKSGNKSSDDDNAAAKAEEAERARKAAEDAARERRLRKIKEIRKKPVPDIIMDR
jgi:serine/threonine-protein kinase